jgi:hypothetical protein
MNAEFVVVLTDLRNQFLRDRQALVMLARHNELPPCGFDLIHATILADPAIGTRVDGELHVLVRRVVDH